VALILTGGTNKSVVIHHYGKTLCLSIFLYFGLSFKKIDEQNRLMAEQNKKIAEQSD
jgi:hypothetical protein